MPAFDLSTPGHPFVFWVRSEIGSTQVTIAQFHWRTLLNRLLWTAGCCLLIGGVYHLFGTNLLSWFFIAISLAPGVLGVYLLILVVSQRTLQFTSDELRLRVAWNGVGRTRKFVLSDVREFGLCHPGHGRPELGFYARNKWVTVAMNVTDPQAERFLDELRLRGVQVPR